MPNGKIRILIIDDEKDLTFLLKENLELTGKYEVVTATSGKEGIALANHKNPHLILLDIIMPKMDGFEVLKNLKENEKTTTIPVIMLTAKADEESRMRAARMYNEDYITKPVGIEELKSRIEAILKLRSSGA